MSSAIPLSDDGDYSQLLETEGRTTDYPFLNGQTKDLVTKLYHLAMECNRVDYVPAAALSTHPDDAAAYLVDETPPAAIGGDVVRAARAYANIPGTQIDYGPSLLIAFPVVPDNAGASRSCARYYATTGGFTSLRAGVVWLYPGAITPYYWTGENKFYGPAKTSTSQLVTLATGGTFTLTYKSSTTAALNWNDSSSTIAAAVNGLASIIADGVTIDGTTYGYNYLGLATGMGGVLWLRVSAGKLTQMITLNSSLTPAAASVLHPYYNVLSAGGDLMWFIDQYVTITAHGLNTAAEIAGIGDAGIRVYPSGSWTAPDANTITLPRSNEGSNRSWGGFGQFLRNYQPASRLVRVKNTTTFYLPGITAGITTPADIPVPSDLQNAQDMINAILTLTGFQVYQAEGPTSWQGPIVKLKTIAINLADLP